MNPFDKALDAMMQLSFDEREEMLELLRKRQSEERRDEIARNAAEALRAFHAGELRSESASEMIERLRQDATQ